MKLVIEIEIQAYGEEAEEVLNTIGKTVTDVVSLCDLAVGTFVKTEVRS